MILDNRYKIIKELGSGVWAQVYKVEDIRTGKIYALKLFKEITAEEFYSKISAEYMHNITMINHSNLINVIDYGNIDNHVYSLKELYDGRNLSFFSFNKNNLHELYHIIIQICHALKELHNNGIVHKDLKLHNVLYKYVDTGYEVKVVDYGFCKIDLGRDPRKITDSLPYVAPEIERGKKALPESDFYSLGVMLYRLTVKSYPFSIKQIKAVMNGKDEHFIPKLPRQINPNIPVGLEKLIMKLLEYNPENRFRNVEQIIEFINNIQVKDYPTNSHIQRADFLNSNSDYIDMPLSNKLLNYTDSLEEGSVRLVALCGSDRSRKDNILTLYKYHILNGKYSIYDYECSEKESDPFYSLIKEKCTVIQEDDNSNTLDLQFAEEFDNISNRIKAYVGKDGSFKDAYGTEDELIEDFAYVTNILKQISQKKPLVFIIRHADYIQDTTVKFLNYCNDVIGNANLLIILSFDYYKQIKHLRCLVEIRVPNLSYNDSKEYIMNLLKRRTINNSESNPLSKDKIDINMDRFVKIIYSKTSGNPEYIKMFLIYLLNNKLIIGKNGFHYRYDIDKCQSPDSVVESIHDRLKQLEPSKLENAQLLAIVKTPLTTDLIKFYLGINELALCDLMEDLIRNDIIKKMGEKYYFTYPDAKKLLIRSCSLESVVCGSTRVIDYFENRNVLSKELDESFLKGLINNARISKDTWFERKSSLALYDTYHKKHKNIEAFSAIFDVIRLDSTHIEKLRKRKLIKDLALVSDSLEFIGTNPRLKLLQKIVENLPDTIEKYLVLMKIYYNQEDYDSAKNLLPKAKQLSFSGKEYLELLLIETKLLSMNRDYEEELELLNKINFDYLNDKYYVIFRDRESVCYYNLGKVNNAIMIAENTIKEKEESKEKNMDLFLASAYNNIGIFYASERRFTEAMQMIKKSVSIFKKYNLLKKLTIMYNNLGDILLRTGETKEAMSYFEDAKAILDKNYNSRDCYLTYINMGEVMIKFGRFHEAKEYLFIAKRVCEKMGNKSGLSNVNANISLVLSKIASFKEYIDFIKEVNPDLLDFKIKRLTPLVKTYIYFLYEIGCHELIHKLLQENQHIDFTLLHEEEFYYNVMTLIAFLRGNYDTAYNNLEFAQECARNSNNDYATVILKSSKIDCLIRLKKIKEAEELYASTIKICDKHEYRYWRTMLHYLRAKIDLQKPKRNLRYVLRNLIKIKNICNTESYRLINIRVSGLIIQIMNIFSAIDVKDEIVQEYRQQVRHMIDMTNDNLYWEFLKKYHYFEKDINKYRFENIAERHFYDRDMLELDIAEILRIKDDRRISMLLGNFVSDILAPTGFAIYSYDEKNSNVINIVEKNFEKDLVYSVKYNELMERGFKDASPVSESIDGKSVLLIPLMIRTSRIGFIFAEDSMNLPFTQFEIDALFALHLQLSMTLIRITEFLENRSKANFVERLLNFAEGTTGFPAVSQLQKWIVTEGINLFGASRGYFITVDEDDDYRFAVGVDKYNNNIINYLDFDKSVLLKVQEDKTPIFVNERVYEDANKTIIDHSRTSSYFCAPIMLDNEFYGIIYFDNYLDKRSNLQIDEDIIRLYMLQVNYSLKSSLKYYKVIAKNAQLVKLDYLKDDFINIVSHELNTPLTKLSAYVRKLMKNSETDEKERQKNLVMVEDEVNTLITKTDEIVTLNKYRLAESIHKEAINVEEIIEVCVEDAEISIQNKRKLFIKKSVDSDLPKACANWESINIMINHLLNNAIRFTRNYGEIRVGVRKSLFSKETLHNKESLVIYVQDNGKGMNEREIENVFKKFYELSDIYSHKSGTVEYESSGLGLGLSICDSIVKLNNGKIWIDSVENEGTTVFVSLPIADKTDK